MGASHLREAAGLIRRRGLAKGVYRDDQGRLCIEGALNLAYGKDSYSNRLTPEQKADEGVVRRCLGVSNVAEWNDRPERTAEEVAGALEAAADSLGDRVPAA